MIGQNPKAEVAPSSISGNRDKEYQFSGRRSPWTESHAKLRVKKRKALGQDDRRIQAELCKNPASPYKEKILSEGTRQKAKYSNYIFSLPLNLKKEKKKEERHLYLCIIRW